MSDKTNEEMTVKKAAGRKPKTPEEKASAAKARAAEKEKAEQMKPEVIIQYQGGETALDALVEAAKEAFRAEKKRTRITELKLYVKPEEGAAYYVVNGKHKGMIAF